jgi:plastocyanin domain-containing protein
MLPVAHLTFAILAAALALTGCSRTEVSGDTPQGAPGAISNRLEISVTADGFVPSHGRVRVGQPVTLMVTRKVERTCATDIVIKDYGINQPLPLDVPVAVTFTPKTAGPVRYACAMNMVAGELVAQ